MTDDAGGGRRGARPTLSPALIETVRSRYRLPAVDAARDLGGSSNLNAALDTAAGRYIVRVYRPHVTEERLGAIHGARRALAAAGLPVPVPLPAGDGSPWVSHEGLLVEVEPHVPHDGRMNEWSRLEAALPLLGRLHAVLAHVSPGPPPAFANHIGAGDLLPKTRRAARRMRRWGDPDADRLADSAEALAVELHAAEGQRAQLPTQLVHGDFWDNNVLFRGASPVAVLDFDFMGARRRVDDLALTLYFTSMEYPEFPVSDEQLRRLAGLVRAYERGLESPLTPAERDALPLALARQPLWSIGGWVADLDDEDAARAHARGMAPALRWARAIPGDVRRWRAAVAP